MARGLSLTCEEHSLVMIISKADTKNELSRMGGERHTHTMSMAGSDTIT